MADPSSAKLLAPVHAKSPDASHTSKLAPTLWTFATTTPGDELEVAALGMFGFDWTLYCLTRFRIQSK